VACGAFGAFGTFGLAASSFSFSVGGGLSSFFSSDGVSSAGGFSSFTLITVLNFSTSSFFSSTGCVGVVSLEVSEPASFSPVALADSSFPSFNFISTPPQSPNQLSDSIDKNHNLIFILLCYIHYLLK